MNWSMKPPHGPADDGSPFYALSNPALRKWRDAEPNDRMYERTRSITRPFGVPGSLIAIARRRPAGSGL